jgi:hypothetical protein
MQKPVTVDEVAADAHSAAAACAANAQTVC